MARTSTSFRLVADDRTANCKGCGVAIVWRKGEFRPLLLSDGTEHVCAKYVRKAFASTGRGRRFVPTAPNMAIAEGTIVARGGKQKACPTCGFDQLEWLHVQQSNGYAKWFLAPFGTSDLSGTLHATRPEECKLGDGTAAPAPKTRRAATKPAPTPIDYINCHKCGHNVARLDTLNGLCPACQKPAPVPTTGLIITLDNGAIITISNVAKFDVVAN